MLAVTADDCRVRIHGWPGAMLLVVFFVFVVVVVFVVLIRRLEHFEFLHERLDLGLQRLNALSRRSDRATTFVTFLRLCTSLRLGP